MSRNLVVCLDGTDNQFCLQNTNVVRMFQSLVSDPSRQLALYDAGVGTIWEPGTLSKASQKVQLWLGMALGLGVTRNLQGHLLARNRHRVPGPLGHPDVDGQRMVANPMAAHDLESRRQACGSRDRD